MVSAVLAHDLLWGMSPAQLPADAPTWACAVLTEGQPVVVRRALAAPGQVAVGVRGPLREQRYASFMALDSISRCVRPEQLCHVESVRDLPALRGLAQLRGLLDDSGLIWGVSGSAGFELATGLWALHELSDLDLILRTPEPLNRNRARALLQRLEAVECRLMRLGEPDESGRRGPEPVEGSEVIAADGSSTTAGGDGTPGSISGSGGNIAVVQPVGQAGAPDSMRSGPVRVSRPSSRKGCGVLSSQPGRCT